MNAKIKKPGKKDIEDILALTPMQEGMLFYYLKSPEKGHYVEQLTLGISGEINVERFEKTWNAVVETNEMLRTLFQWEKLEKPIQVVLKKHEPEVIFYDISEPDSSQKEKHLEEIKRKDRRGKFDIRRVPFRVILCKVEDDKYEMIISNHHILYDGWSTGIILKEFLKVYNDLAYGNEFIRPAKTRYKEFIKWDQRRDIDRQNRFWKDYLAGFAGPTELSIKRKRNEKKLASTRNIRIHLPGDVKVKLESFVKKHKITLASLLYTAWGLLLQRYNDTDDVAFGTTVSGRSAKIKGIKDIVGLFINTVPLRFTSHANERVEERMTKINDTLAVREEYENTPLVEIMKCAHLAGKEELFDSIVIIENYPLGKKFSGENSVISFESYSMSGFESTNYDLTVGITLFDDISIDFNCDETLFEGEVIKNLAEHYRWLVIDIIDNPGKKISEIEMMPDKEKECLLHDFNNTGTGYHDPKDVTLHALFEKQADQVPHNIAVVFEDKQITYKEINKKANQLALVLEERGVKSDSIVAIIINESIAMVIGLLGILKAGGAYLPIDPNYPRERIDYMLRESNAKVLVSQLSEFSPCPLPLASPASPANLAYIIYTSGTTGKPKGVMVEHRSVVNYVRWRLEFYRYTANDVTLQPLSYCFDGFASNFYSSLCSGGTLIMVPAHKRLEYDSLKEIVKRQKVTNVSLVPGIYENLLESGEVRELKSLRFVVLAGESPGAHLIERSQKLHPHLIIGMEYGPTETTVTAAAKGLLECPASPAIIGKPIANVQIYILDRFRNPLPLYAPGEIYISGAGVSRGYLNMPELTAEKFIDSPYSPTYPLTHSTIYRTGDLARWLPDGNIEFLGRIDQQVKIRGFRIEPGEIENRLLTYGKIKEAIVLARGDNNDKYLCAYMVAKPGETNPIDQSGLREHLAGHLPDYMVPAYFVQLDNIPLTPNGKVDRKALPEPEMKTGENYIAPRNETEKKLVEIWSGVLGIEKEKIGIDDNFFHLGGHSLKAAALIFKIYKKLDINVSLADVFKHSTVRELAAGPVKEAAGKPPTAYTAILPVEKKEYYETSHSQSRIWFMSQFQEASITYNIPTGYIFTGSLDAAALADVFAALLERHESLRTVFITIDGGPKQKILPVEETDFTFEEIDLRNSGDNEIKVRELANADADKPFNLSGWPLFRTRLIRLADEKYVVLLNIHHIISDALSMMVILEEIITLYDAAGNGRENSLKPLKIHYKEFTAWQSHRLTEDEINRQQGYWLSQLAGNLPRLELPRDRERSPHMSYQGGVVSLCLDEFITGKLNELARQHDATMFMVMLSALNILFYRFTGQEDIILGTLTADREHADLEGQVGYYLNTLPMRNRFHPGNTAGEILEKVRLTTLSIYEHQAYPFDKIVEDLGIQRNIRGHPLFDVMVDMVNIENTERLVEKNHRRITLYQPEVKRSKFDLTIYIFEGIDRLNLDFEFNACLFERETISHLADCFEKLLNSIVEKPSEKIDDLIIDEEPEIMPIKPIARGGN